MLAKDEDDPLDPSPPPAFRRTLDAIRSLEDMVRRSDVPAIALRYGWFYGQATSIARDGAIVELLRKRRLPIAGGGAGIWSFIHADDAAEATLAALANGGPGIYNVGDNDRS